MTGGYGVDPEALRSAERGIDGIIGELNDLGIEGVGDNGRGFSVLKLSHDQAGHPEVQGEFETFCETWMWGVRDLVQDGNEIAVRLGLNAGKYYQAEQEASDTLKYAVNSVAGNPNLTEEQVASMTPEQLAAQMQPDYSKESFERVLDEEGAGWKQTIDDTKATPMMPGMPVGMPGTAPKAPVAPESGDEG